MPNLLSAKRCQKRKIAPADQLKAVDDIDMPFTMSALETIINFGQILEIKTVTLIKKLGDIFRRYKRLPTEVETQGSNTSEGKMEK